MIKITKITLWEPNMSYKAMLESLIGGLIFDYCKDLEFEDGSVKPFYTLYGSERSEVLRWAVECGASLLFMSNRYGDMTSRHRDGIKLGEFIAAEIEWLKKTILANIESCGIGYHETKCHYYSIKHNLPYVCLRGSGGGGWSYIGKIEGDILYVPKGTKGMFIGKGGAKIKEICSAVGKRLKIEEVSK